MNSFIPQNPTVNILTDATGKVLAVATNVDPEIKVTLTQSPAEFTAEAVNKPFNVAAN